MHEKVDKKKLKKNKRKKEPQNRMAHICNSVWIAYIRDCRVVAVFVSGILLLSDVFDNDMRLTFTSPSSSASLLSLTEAQKETKQLQKDTPTM